MSRQFMALGLLLPKHENKPITKNSCYSIRDSDYMLSYGEEVHFRGSNSAIFITVFIRL